MPETWLPTWTFLTGESAPLAATDWTMSPTLMTSVLTEMGAALAFAWRQYQKPAAPPTTRRRSIQFNQLMRFLRTAMRCSCFGAVICDRGSRFQPFQFR